MFRANNFDKLLDKATSNLRLDPDWPTILQICDLIRQNDCSPKYAVAAVKKKLYSQNPHQAMFALLTLESIVKNCGSNVHEEVTSKVFCEMLRELVKSTQHENLRNKILELIQAWAFAFRNNPKYRSVQDTVNILKAEGFKFPSLKESDAMFSADTAPEWADGEVCHRCRVAFSLMVRRHHCRACGQVFCQQCSSKTSTLPKFGIEKEVRVCDACYDKVSRPPSSSTKVEIVDTSNDYGPTQPQKRPPGKSAEELQEEEELQLALALSQSEAEQKEKERRSRTHITTESSLRPNLSPSPSSVSASPDHSQGNAELSRYLDRNYWEQRLSRDVAPTAPAPGSVSSRVSQDTNDEFVKPAPSKTQEDDAEDKEIDEFVETLKSQVEIFVNRMKSNSSRGRSIANDTSVQTLFMNITAMHSRLLKYIQQQDDKRVYLESLQDKVNQVRDSRAALDTLRAEHAARQAARAEAAERQRQLQMAAKLHAMRKKKHEYLQYQRQLALQRVQEQEREMQIRQEQQKHQYMMSNSTGYFMPGVTMPQYQAGYPNQALYANPQFHPQIMAQSTTDGSLAMPGQPQMSQANMPMNPNSQSVPQMTNAFSMSTSGPTSSQAAGNQPIMSQPNIRPMLSQQTNMQHQIMMQQMHQMRMSMQPGHPMAMPNMPNGMPGQSGQQPNSQITKNLSNHPQQTSSMMPSIATGQQNMAPPPMNTNPLLGMQMQNMRMPIMQGQNANQVPVSPYSNNMGPNMQQPPQAPIAGQPMSHPAQQMAPGQTLPSQNQMTMPNHVPTTNQGSTQGQVSQNQQGPMSLPNQHMPPTGQIMMQGHIPQPNPGNQIPPGQLTGQQASIHGPQSMPQQIPGPQQMQMHSQQMPHQMMQGQLPPCPPMQGAPLQQGQPIPQGQPIAQGQPTSQSQHIKMQQNFNSPPSANQPPTQNQPNQQVQTPIKSEHNNNTAELISFD
ncbi:hypothetical protein ACJJTC_011834 [Scirpophaga incertulas]